VTHTYRRRLTATAIVAGVVCAGTPALAAPAFAAQKGSTGTTWVTGTTGIPVPASWIDQITRAEEVNFAESHWNWTAWNDSTPVAFGSGQPNYQCAEFVARSMAAAGLIPGLGPNAPQDAYFNYTAPNGKVYDLLLISPLPQYNNIYAYMMDSGVGIDVGDNPAAAQPGDFIVTYLGPNGESSHMGLVATAPTATAEGTVDAHNNARYRYGYHFYAPSHLVELAPNALLKVLAWAASFHKVGSGPTTAPKAVTPNRLVNPGGFAGPIGPQV
jgi:hypothetical protein